MTLLYHKDAKSSKIAKKMKDEVQLRNASALLCVLCALCGFVVHSRSIAQEIKPAMKELVIKKTDDFDVDGTGKNAAWENADWQPLTIVSKNTLPYETKLKILYSPKGIYTLVDCQDATLTATKTEFLDDIYTEDVVEMFIWTDEKHPVYFEYEISPLNVELPILVSNNGKAFFGWAPWHYEGDRVIRKATSIRGGMAEPGAKIDGWTAEFFIPFRLLTGLPGVPPQPGDSWRVNVYRIDYDLGPKQAVQWAWDTNTGGNFHNYREFGRMTFEQ